MPQPANIPTLDVCVIDGLPLEKSAYPKDDQNNTRRYRQKERMHAPESITYKNNLPGAKLGHYQKGCQACTAAITLSTSSRVR